MANAKLSGLPISLLGSELASDDNVYVVDTSAGLSKKMSAGELATGMIHILTTTQLGALSQTQRGALVATGATAGTPGTIGFPVAANAGQQAYVLQGDNTWVPQTGGGGSATELTTTQIASLATTQMAYLSTTALDALTTTQTSFLKVAQLGHLHVAANISDFSTAVAATPSVTANTAKVTNATHDGEVTGATTLTIANKQTLTASGGVNVSNAPTVIGTAAPAITLTYGTGANTVCQGNDGRLSDARTPTAHTHTASAVTDFSTAAGLVPITTTQISLLTTTQIATFTTTQVSTLPVAQIGHLHTSSNITDFSTAAGLVSFTTTQLAALTTTQLGTLTQTQLGALEMTGSNGTVAGTIGFVPAPGALDNAKVLRGDKQWVAPVAGLNWRGAWDTAQSYLINDIVSYSGSTYICILAANDQVDVPTMALSYWGVFIPQGTGNITATAETTVAGDIPIYDSTTGQLLKTSGVPVKPLSPITTAVASSAGAITLNMALGTVFTTTLTESIVTVTISNPPASGVCGTVVWLVTQDATTARTIALPTGGVWATGITPSFITLGARYVLVFKTTNAGTNWIVASEGGGGGLTGLTPGGVVIGGADGQTAQAGTTIHVDATNGKVGIGTATPSNLLSVALSDPSSTNLASTATSAHKLNGYSGTLTVAMLTDGLTATIDQTAFYIPGAIGLIFASSFSCTKVRFYSGDSRIKTFTAQKTINGTDWTDISATSCSENASGTGTLLSFAQVAGWGTVNFGAVDGIGFRIYSNELWTSTIAVITEMEIWGYSGFNANVIDATSTGKVGFGTTTPAAKLDVNNTGDSLSMRVFRGGSVATDYIAEWISNWNAAGQTQAAIQNDGTLLLRNLTIGSFSDRNLKTNITDLSPKLYKLLQVRMVKFQFIGDTLEQAGVIAQELEPLFPGLVYDVPNWNEVPDSTWTPGTGQTELDRPKTRVPVMIPDSTWTPGTGQTELDRPLVQSVTKIVKYSVFLLFLIKALQEFHAEYEQFYSDYQFLVARVTALENQP